MLQVRAMLTLASREANGPLGAAVGRELEANSGERRKAQVRPMAQPGVQCHGLCHQQTHDTKPLGDNFWAFLVTSPSCYIHDASLGHMHFES